MNFKTYVIDDEFFAVDILRDYIGRTPGLELLGSSTEPLQALQELGTVDAPDIVFLDLEMPELGGLKLAALLPAGTNVVFTTSHRKFGPEAFELGAADYLLKPIMYDRFLACISRIRNKNRSNTAGAIPEAFSFFVKSDMKGKLIRIVAADIIYISSELNYVNIHLATEKIKAYLTMTELLEKLPANQFCQTHRSFIVNMGRIRVMEPGILRLDNQVVIDIGPKFKEQLLRRLDAKLIVSHRH